MGSTRDLYPSLSTQSPIVAFQFKYAFASIGANLPGLHDIVFAVSRQLNLSLGRRSVNPRQPSQRQLSRAKSPHAHADAAAVGTLRFADPTTLRASSYPGSVESPCRSCPRLRGLHFTVARRRVGDKGGEQLARRFGHLI